MCVCAYVCGECKVATGTDYVPVILFITVGAHCVSVVDSMIYIHLFQDRNPLHTCVSGSDATSKFQKLT